MKQVFRKTILLAFCIAITTTIFAQSTEWGVKTGVNLATQIPNITKISNNDIRPGMYAGLFAEYRVSNFLGIQGELLYSMMGGKNTGYVSYPHYLDPNDIYEGEVVFTNKNNYIVLPIMAKLYVAKKLSIDLGPQFAYMVSEKIKGFHFDDVDRQYDVLFGAGFSYKIHRKIDVSARYNLGLVELYSTSWRNNVIQFGLGYRIK